MGVKIANLALVIIGFWEERLSIMAVNRMLIEEADFSDAKRAKVADRAAAGYILQGAPNRLRCIHMKP